MCFFPDINYNKRYNLETIYAFSQRIYLQSIFRDMNYFLESQKERGEQLLGPKHCKILSLGDKRKNWGQLRPILYVE